MRRFLVIVIGVLSLCVFLFARGGTSIQGAVWSAVNTSQLGSGVDSLSKKNNDDHQNDDEESKLINIKSDFASPIKRGDSVWYFLGNFAAQHNGAVITCDSAVSYSDSHYEFFGNVLINQNTTYIYGDRADYNRDINIVEVFSPIIKVIDEDATLFTYKFKFDTKNSIGVFDNGGILVNRDSKVEAIRGYYYSDIKTVTFVDEVEMRNDEYELKGDSVIYNMATDNAKYFRRTNIWNVTGDYLYADRGTYLKLDTLHRITKNGYVLTEKDELWSDSLYYYSSNEHIIMHNNIQIDDTEHKTLIFGDYGEYWKYPGNVLVTRSPSIINYDLEQGDSVFMRGDTINVFTINREHEKRVAEKKRHLDSISLIVSDVKLAGDDEMPTTTLTTKDTQSKDSLEIPKKIADSLSKADVESGTQTIIDTMAVDSTNVKFAAEQLPDTLTPKERKAKLREIAKQKKIERKEIEAKERKIRLDEIAAKRQEKATEKLLAEKKEEEAKLIKRKLKEEAKLKDKIARAAKRGKVAKIDSAELKRMDLLLLENQAETQDFLHLNMSDTLMVEDSLSMQVADSLVADSLQKTIIPEDSIYKLIKAYRNVKVFRTDVQNVCDSLVSISSDSTTHLYINPVLWNLESQITSDVMDIFTANQQIIRAEFIGSPIMASRIDSTRYNQVAGKKITSFFTKNEIYKNDVDGNAQTIYFMQDDETNEVTGVAVIESGSTTFFIENRQVVGITYRQNPVWKIYPLDKIPADVPLNLDGFKWQGDRRPTQKDVFDRYRRPSERESRSAIEKPLFPIENDIDEHKKLLLTGDTWTDRDDLVLPETVKWMLSLGFEVGQPRKEQNSSEPEIIDEF